VPQAASPCLLVFALQWQSGPSAIGCALQANAGRAQLAGELAMAGGSDTITLGTLDHFRHL